MLGKILVIDQIATNRIAMRAKLGAAQFDVKQACNIQEALDLVVADTPDLIITDIALPDGSARDLITQLTFKLEGARPPILVLSEGLTEPVRLSLLAAGANDVIKKPVDNLLLLARIRSHVRAAHSDVEWHLRDDTTRALGLGEAQADFIHPGRVRIVGRNTDSLNTLLQRLEAHLPNAHFALASAEDVIPEAECDPADAFVLALGRNGVPDMLRLLSTLRCHRASRHAAILVLQEDPETELAAYALDMGASDLVTSETSMPEIAMRLGSLLDRKRHSDQLRATVRTGLEAAVCDPLTGLHNRRYAMPHLTRILDRAMTSGKPVSVMIADIDHFKRVNDTHGHAAGDIVLKEVAKRLRDNLRDVDLVARIGGEEFLIVLPGVPLDNAHKAAERVCERVREMPILLPKGGQQITATISIGMTIFDPSEANDWSAEMPAPDTLLDRADQALYMAKERGRNRVRLAKPAA